ncbi:MAG: VOC family protein [Myxococcota bacterium]
MKMRALNHLNIIVSNVERSSAFYEDLFGMERLWREGDFVFLRCGDTDLALTGGIPRVDEKFHMGFRVDSRAEVDAWLEEVRRSGVALSHGPKDYGNYYTFSCRDPDGYAVEIYWEAEPRGRTGAPE